MLLAELKYSNYSGSIHLIFADPFIIYYWTPSQLVVYKNLRKLYICLFINATGIIIKKIKRTTEGILFKPKQSLFLYKAIVSANNYQSSIM